MKTKGASNIALIISVALWAGMLAVSVASAAEHTDRTDTSESSHAANHLQAFPPPETGMVRHVLPLPAQRDESLYTVELIVGKIVETDPHNKYFLTGRIQSETIQGWGFTRYVIETLGPMAGTPRRKCHLRGEWVYFTHKGRANDACFEICEFTG